MEESDNFLRFLEDWSGATLNYGGSLVSLYNATYTTRIIQVLHLLGVSAANPQLYFRLGLHLAGRPAAGNAAVPRRGEPELPAAV